MDKRTYLELKDGNRFEIDIKNGELLRLACCDCGLVHDIAFAIEENGALGIAMSRNQRATSARRAHSKKAIEVLRELMTRASDDDYRFIYKMALLAFLCDRHGYAKVMGILDKRRRRERL